MQKACRLGTSLVLVLVLAGAGLLLAAAPARAQKIHLTGKGAPIMDQTVLKGLQEELIDRHGEEHKARVIQGLAQVLARWRSEDGGPEELAGFAGKHFISDPEALQDTFDHLQYALEMLRGHANETTREVSRFQMLDEGPLRPVDGLLAALSPGAHINEDLFDGKVAFVALLNFPLSTLEQRLKEGPGWSRERWARARLVQHFEHRLPASVVQEIARASTAAQSYIDGYNLHMDSIVASDGSKPFRAGLELISHWGLRDEIRALYGRKDGPLPMQRLITRVMERIIRQEIPREQIGSGSLEWDPATNLLRSKGGQWKAAPREEDERYAQLLEVFRATRKADPYFPDLPTHMDRVFSREREMPEQRLDALLESVIGSKVATRVGELISKRLGRPLEPFDLWYTGFKASRGLDERAMDQIVQERYPTMKAFQDDLPNILGKLGFSPENAAFLAKHIVVDAARGAGHAYPSELREGRSHLRTRMGQDGMDYKGFNIAMHELGHNVEQVFSITRMDHTLLAGVPNNGFTEAFAFLFQARDLEMLGQAADDPRAEALRTLDRFWSAFEIAGVALLDAKIWHWMYDHPEASPAELRDATVELARALWNRFYEPVFGVKDIILPAIYSHIICYGLYTPDYPLGFLITFQVEQYMKGRSLAEEMERMCRLGRLAPDVWMQQAVGSPVSSAPLLEATEAALHEMSGA